MLPLPLEATRESALEAALGISRADLVVLLALLAVTNDVIGLSDLLEALVFGGVTGVGVGVIFARQFAIGLLDVLSVGVLRDS